MQTASAGINRRVHLPSFSSAGAEICGGQVGVLIATRTSPLAAVVAGLMDLMVGGKEWDWQLVLGEVV